MAYNRIDRISEEVRRELDKLDETERKVIIARFVSERSQRDVAKEMNVSQMYISRLDRRVLERLRAANNERRYIRGGV